MWFAPWSVLLFLVAVPGCASLIDVLGGHDLSRVAQVAVALICAIALAGRAAIRPRAAISWPGPALLGASVSLLLALASVFHAPVVSAAARELAMVLGLAAIAAVIADCRKPRQMEILAITVVVAASLYAGLVLMSLFISVAHAAPLERFTVILGYDNYRLFNHVQTVVLPLLAIATSRSFRGGEFARLAWFALAVHFALLIFTLGRATAVAVLAAALLSLILFRQAAIAQARHLAMGAGIGALAYVGLFVMLPAVSGSLAQAPAPNGLGSLQSDHSRLMLWRLALEYVAQQPLLGIGPMHFAHYMNGKAAHPHNLYLQLAAEWGVPLLIVLVALSAWAGWRMARAIKSCTEAGPSSMGIGLFTAVVAVAIDAMFSGNFVMPVPQVWVALAIGWAIAWTCLNARGGPQVHSVVASRYAVVVVVAALVTSQVWLCWSIAPDLRNFGAYLDHVRVDLAKTDKTSPRFWSNGWF